MFRANRRRTADLRARHRIKFAFDLSGIPVRRAEHKPGAQRLYTERSNASRTANQSDDQDRERRLELLIRRLPERMQNAVHWLRDPSRRWVRIPAGLLLIVGSVLSILPVFGLWMLPLGIVLLAEDVPPLRRLTARVLAWIEQRHPNWMGLATSRNPR